jgi:hypothetical protein
MLDMPALDGSVIVDAYRNDIDSGCLREQCAALYDRPGDHPMIEEQGTL